MKPQIDGLRRTVQLMIHLVPMGWSYICLHYRIKGFSDELQAPHWNEFHKHWAKEPLLVVLHLRGFYVKVAQMIAGMPDMIVPKPYLDNLKCLLEDVPAQPFSTMRVILEDELGCEINEVFKSFEESPIGAASIGQVHRAQLIDGTNVVVKIQYPETEKYFRLDLATIIFLFKYINEDAVEPLKLVEKNFEIEFNYALEGANLRRMFSEVQPHFTDLEFPQPYDEKHPNLPPAVVKKGRALVTKRVLTMDLCKGESVQRLSGQVLEQMAKAQGCTKREFEDKVQKQMLEPEDDYMEDMLNLVPSQSQMEAIRTFFKGRDFLRNAHAAQYNLTLGMLTGSKIEYTQSQLPLNGPALLQRLFDIHGFQIFEVGAFNADPHAGNMLIDEASGTLSLIDYGQLIDISAKERGMMAKLIVAFEHGDAAGLRACYVDMGVEVTDNRTGEVNSEALLMSLFAAHFEGIASLKRMKQYLGVTTLKEVMVQMPTAFQVKGLPDYYLMVNRCVMMLSGVGVGVGFPGVDAAKLLLPSAERYLNKNMPQSQKQTQKSNSTPTHHSTGTPQQEQKQNAKKQEEESTLEEWLKQHAGLHGKKLAVALNQCDDGMVESVADLEHLHNLGQLAEVFPQSMLRGLVTAALEQQQAEQPAQVPTFPPTSPFLAQIEKGRKVVEDRRQAWAVKMEENRKKHQGDLVKHLQWAIDGIEKNASKNGACM